MTDALAVEVRGLVKRFVDYLGLTPATYAQFGTPAQNLPGLLPSQFAIQTVSDLITTAPFSLLGAVIAGGDWERGTLRTSLPQGQSRARCFGGQVLAIMTACAASVVVSFALRSRAIANGRPAAPVSRCAARSTP